MGLEREKRRRQRLREQPDQKAWQPLPGPQTLAIETLADITGYGGAAGGGKTDLAVGLALTQHYKSIIFRREYPQLKDITRRAKELTEGRRTNYNANTNILTLDDGRTIEFGAMQRLDDWEKFKGRPHDLKSYDEATEFIAHQVRSSMAWCRTTRPGQRCRVLLTFNPPTNEDGQWVFIFFAPWLDPSHPNPAKAGELRWFAVIDGEDTEVESGEPFEHNEETIYPQSRTFIPARLSDNPYQDTPEYRATLQSLPEPLRSQLLRGDFNIGIDEDPWKVIPRRWVELANERWATQSKPEIKLTCMGMDVAHGGKDQTVLANRFGAWMDRLKKYPGKETPDGRTAAALAVKAYEPGGIINVDAIGYGASAAERLAQDYALPAIAINVANKSEHTDKTGKYKMTNVRAEMYWRLREALDPEGDVHLALPPDPELKADLCAPRYEITPAGIKIESKVDIKDRMGRSPDAGDAVALTMLLPKPPNTLRSGPSPLGKYRG